MIDRLLQVWRNGMGGAGAGIDQDGLIVDEERPGPSQPRRRHSDPMATLHSDLEDEVGATGGARSKDTQRATRSTTRRQTQDKLKGKGVGKCSAPRV